MAFDSKILLFYYRWGNSEREAYVFWYIQYL